MIKETKYCLSHLADFDGRDARQTFWYYVLALVIFQFVVGILTSVPLIVSVFNTTVDAVQKGADPQNLEGLIMASTAEWVGTTVWVSAGAYLITAVLFVAAFVRRLHDAGFAGYWAAIPIITQAAAIYYSFSQLDEVQRMMASVSNPAEMQAMQAEMTSNPASYISWIGYLIVIGFGVLKSQEGPNRYGEPPREL